MQGNPNLKPGITNSLELSYNKTYAKNNNVLASLYYKRTTDLITRYQQQAIDAVSGNEEIISTFINANAADAYGVEVTSVNYLTCWWDAIANVNVYNSKINTGLTVASIASMWSCFGKLNNNFKQPQRFTW